MKIYTKMGDKGETSLFGGMRTLKSSARVEAYGAVDELNAAIGATLAFLETEKIKEVLSEVQKDLFTIGAKLADPKSKLKKQDEDKSVLNHDRIEVMETMIDQFQEELEPINNFILPGGTKGGAMLHLARGVCRRAERRIVALTKEEIVPQVILGYVNRLSDFLFVLARVENKHGHEEEIRW